MKHKHGLLILGTALSTLPCSKYALGSDSLLLALNIREKARLEKSGFMSQLKMQNKRVEFEIVGLDNAVTLDSNISFKKVEVLPSQVSILTEYLDSNQVNPHKVERIIQELLNGVGSSPCVGNRQNCIISSGYVIDYYNNKVRMFLSPEDFLQKKSEGVQLSVAEEPMLVSSWRVNADRSNNEFAYFADNRNVFGLGAGYVVNNNYLSDNYVSTSDLFYARDFSGSRYVIGMLNNASEINNTASKSIFANNYSVSFGMGSSNRLKRTPLKDRTLQVFSTVEGSVEIKRNDKTIFRRMIYVGQNKIQYSSLEQGIYSVDIIIKDNSGNIVSQYKELITNTSSISNKSKDLSWYLRGGILSEDAFWGSTTPKNRATFLEGGLGYQWLDNIALGYSLGAANGAYHNLTVDYTADPFFGSLSFLSGVDLLRVRSNLRYGNFNLGLEERKSNNSKKTSEMLFNDTGVRYNAGVSFNLFGIGGSSSVFYEEREDTKDNPSSDSFFGVNSVFTYMFPNQVNITSTVQYSNEEISVALNLSLPLGRVQFTQSAEVYGSDSSFSSGISYSKNIDENISIQGSYNESYGFRKERRLFANANYFGDKGNVSLRGGTWRNENAYYSVGADLQTSLYLTKNDITLNRDSDKLSALRIENEPGNSLTAKVENIIDNTFSTNMIEGSDLLPLDSYSRYKLDLGTNNPFLSVSALKDDMFDLTPGKVKYIKPSVKSVSQAFVIAKNSNDEVICKGVGCISKTRISGSVYKLSIEPSERVTLIADKKVCASVNLSSNKIITVVCK
ncbi:TcfC E-set like domain-containing protein [Vibrio harveyi]|nr:TcfC E-set like domain-containing protein [Vibrio harveyi]